MSFFSVIYLIYRVLASPLEILFTLLIFILNKNLEVLPLQLTVMAIIKPVSSLVSFYICSFLFEKTSRIRVYLILNIALGAISCFYFPFTDNPWFFIASFALFMITNRALMPAWMEVLKSNTDSQTLAKTVSYGNIIFFVMNIFLSPLFCFFMDDAPQIWKFLFFCIALIKMISLILVFTINSDTKIKHHQISSESSNTWKKAIKPKAPFLHYLVLYCIGGIGIIGTQPILPIYFEEVLKLSYTSLGLAFSFSKGIAFLLSSSFWVRYAQNFSLYRLNAFANMFTVLYFILLMFSSREIVLIYPAYFFYGIMLAGCELSRDVSGPYFSGQQNSTIYSSLNLATIGIRGCIFPLIGTLLYHYTGATYTFTIAALICVLGSVYGLFLDRRYRSSLSACA